MIKLLIAITMITGFAVSCNARGEDMGIVVLKTLTDIQKIQVSSLKREADREVALIKQHMEQARALELQGKSPKPELDIVKVHMDRLSQITKDVVTITENAKRLSRELDRAVREM